MERNGRATHGRLEGHVTLFILIGSNYLLKRSTLCFAMPPFEVVVIRCKLKKNIPTTLKIVLQ